MSIEEGWHTVERDGKKLYTKTWKTQEPAKARLVFIHGFSDHCNTYDTLFTGFVARGIEIFTFDQRGWGRSVSKPAEKGATGPTTRVLDDITSFLRSVIPCPVPLFLMGHSMGGGEVLHYIADGPADVRRHIRGFLLESPFVDLSPESRPNPVTVFMGRLASKVLPRHQMLNALDVKLLCRDSLAQKRFQEDQLCHDTGTFEGLAGLLDRSAQLASGKVNIRDDAGEGGILRMWIAHGDKDGITSYPASKAMAGRIKAADIQFKTYEGYFHRLHDEPEGLRDVFINDAADWILARSTDPVRVNSQTKL